MATVFTPAELAALKDFRARIPDILCQLDEFDAHDRNLIRWLRARDMNLDKAEKMIRENMKIRKEHNLDELQYRDFPEVMLEKLPFTPCGHDKQGIVVCIIPTGIWDLKSFIQSGQREEIKLYLAQIFERYFRYMKNNHSIENFKTEINTLFDYNQFSIQDYMSKQVISFVIELLRGYEADYPERLKTAYIVNVPKVYEIFWSMIRPIIPAGTMSKIRILGGSSDHWRKILLENIDFRELPSQYGGSNTAHPWYANRFGDIWPARTALYQSDDFLTANIPAGEKFEQSFQLSAGQQISWNFKTVSYDIGFEFTQNGKRMFPYARADAHICVQDGCVDVIEDGTYSLVFDNTYSKYRSKTLHYIIRTNWENKIQEKYTWRAIIANRRATHF